MNLLNMIATLVNSSHFADLENSRAPLFASSRYYLLETIREGGGFGWRVLYNVIRDFHEVRARIEVQVVP
jgi:hypothetical protein